MLPTAVVREVQNAPVQGGQYIANATVTDNAYAHFGDVYNYHNVPDTRKRKLALLLDSLSFTRMGARERNVTDAISNTCDWLFEDAKFCAWADHQEVQQHHGFFWIKGKPGTGKSTLIKRVLSWAKTEWPDEIVLSYFFNGRSPNELEQTVLGVYRTLLHQMLSRHPHLHNDFLANFAAKEQDGKVEPWEEAELQNFLMHSVCSECTKSLTIFVDAMDEGHEEDVERMVFFFEELASRAFSMDIQLRVCLSSRHYPHIELSHSISLILEHEAGHFNDIETYIDNSFPSGGAAMNDLRSLVLERSQGIFLWVSLVITLLKAAYRRVKGPTAMMKILECVPEDLHKLFASLLSRDLHGLDECVTLLQWVLYAFESITPDILCTAIACTHPSAFEGETRGDSEHQDRYILNTSRGLVECIEDFFDESDSSSIADDEDGDAWLDEPVSQTVQFIHQTVVDYFLLTKKIDSTSIRVKNLSLEDHTFRAEFCHAKLAQTCLTYLIHLSVTTSLTSETLKNWPLAPYAAKFWWKHVAMSGSLCDQSLTDLAANFLMNERSRQIWVQLYDAVYPTNMNSTEILRWGRQVLKHPSLFRHRPGPLCYAAMLELPEVVETMMLRHPAVDVWDETWGNALQIVCSKRLWDLAERFLNLGADPNAQLGRRHSGTPLQLASFYGKETTVQLLVERGADVNASSARFATPLQEASRNGHNAVVQKLILAGANLNHDSATGDNALMLAFEAGHDMVGETLLSAGAGVGLEWNTRWPSIVQALLDGRVRIVQNLAFAGLPIDPSCFDYVLGTLTKQEDQKRLAALFVTGLGAFGAAWQSMSGNTMEQAGKTLSIAIVESLLTAGDHVSSTKSSLARNLAAALLVASAQGYKEMTKLLLRAGADVNTKLGTDHIQQSALTTAAKAQHFEIVRLLLQAGAAVSITDLYSDGQPERNEYSFSETDGQPHSVGNLILDGVLQTDAATTSRVTRELFDQAVRSTAGPHINTNPLQVLTGYWSERFWPGLCFVDEATGKSVWSSALDLDNATTIRIPRLWDSSTPDVEPDNSTMKRALCDAARRGNTRVIDLLIAHGLKIDQLVETDSDPRSNPLYVAAQGGSLVSVKHLLGYGVVLSPHNIGMVFPQARFSILELMKGTEWTDLDDKTLEDALGFWATASISILRELLLALQRRNRLENAV